MKKQDKAQGIAGGGAAQRRVDERSDSTRSAAAPPPASGPPPSGRPEVATLARAQRRRFSNEQKRAILGEAEQCQERGQLGALLRRHGIYSTTLKTWQRQLKQGLLTGGGRLAPGPRGRRTAEQERIAALERTNQRLEQQLEEACLIIDIQKKTAQLFGEKLKEWAVPQAADGCGNGKRR